ncbi:Ig-like domain-containing protein [Enterobacter hormaechei]|uniref:Ig-like domain-containing protein n=1 Tax=Enterobacter hormaechei TaxID=158836 RepID=UPI0024DE9A92|nr:Ig-like domain-containing protein [Enterobacter hormaechei]MDK2357160.1 Ig-like domain-containing protein [Enterobacter hormaechei]
MTGTTGADGKATAEVTSTAAGTYLVTATVNGKATQKNTTFVADSATAEITDANLTINPDGAVADGVAKNGVEATVTDANGNLVPGVEVDFSISEGANIHVVQGTTDENGKAYAEITSMKAGTFLVSAHVVGSAQFARKNTRFVADMSTAKIELVRLGDKEQFVVGSNANYTATAMDANGNLITDAEFELEVKGSENASGAILVVNDGVATLFVTDTKVGDVELNIVLQQNNDVKASGSVAFIADKGTATIAENDLTILKTGAVASGIDENSVQARVTDAYGNILSDMDVTFGVNKTATLTQNVIKTDSEGLAVAHLTDTEVETVTVTATINGNSQAVEVEFVVGEVNPSASTATLEPVRILANGTEQATITVKLEDFFGHPVPGKNVTVEIVENQPITASASVLVSETVDHADGSYSLTASGTKAGTVQFNIFVDGNSIDLVTDWLTLVSTGEIAESDMVINPDNAVADGIAKNVVTAVVKDFSGTPVAGDEVTFNVEDGAVLTPITTTTGDDGKAVAEITSTKAGAFKVTATVNGKSTSKDTSFVADVTTANLVLAPVNNEAEYYYAGYKAIFTATVVDGNDNLITDADFEVHASGTETVVATLESVSAGKGTISISDTAVGDVNLIVKLKGNEQVSDSAKVKFVADITSAQILDADVYVENDGALAASYGSIVLTFTVKDRYGNPVPRALGWRHYVDFTPEGHSGDVSPSSASVDDGTGATIAVTAKSGMAGEYRVALTIDKTNYIYRNIYYVGVMAPLEVFTDNALANGVDENRVGLHIFQDGTPRVIANTNVQFEADNNAILSSHDVLTDSEGYAYVTVTSKTTGPVNITARYAGNQQRTTSINFLQQIGEIADSDLIVNPDNAVANGRDKNVVTAFVKDTSGQPVVGAEVTFEKEEGPVLTPVITTTGDDGKAIAEITSTKAGAFKVTATVNGKSTSKDTTFVADATTARMVLTAINPLDSHPAGSKANFTALVQDANGNVFKDAEIELSASGTETTEAEITGVSDGVANLFVTDTKVGEVSLNVNQKGNSELSAAETVKFIADISTARVLESDFDTPKANAIANGEDEVVITALVTDQYGNPVDVAATQSTEKARIMFVLEGSDEQSPIITQTSSYTYEGNKLTQRTSQINSASFPTYPVVNGIKQNIEKRTINFIPVLTSLKALTDGAQANGVTPNRIEVVVKYGSISGASAVNGALVHLTAGNGAVIEDSVSTAVNGSAIANVRSTNPGISTVTATYVQNGITQQMTVDVEFVNAATILDNDLTINPDNAVANGADKNVVTAIVTDGNGTAVAGEEVTFSVENGPELTVISATSDADGKAVAELTSTVAGSFKVTATVNGNTVSKNTTFIADASTAAIELTRTDVQETYVAGTRIGYTAVAKDAHGNTITDAEFAVKAEGGTAASASITATNNGVAVLSLYDTRAGETKLTVTLANNAEVAADDTVTYVPDESSSKISNMTVVKNLALAGFLEENIVTFDATDKFGNLIPSVNSTAFRVAVKAPTGGQADWSISQLGSGSFEIRIKGSTANQSYEVGVDYAIAGGTGVSRYVVFAGILAPLSIETNAAPADGVSKNVIKGRVYDGLEGPHGSSGPKDIKLNFKANNGAILTAVPGSDIYSGNGTSNITIWSDSSGYASVEITNTSPGDTTITMTEISHNSAQSESAVVSFSPDVVLSENNMVLDPDNSPADGVSKNVVTTTVTNQSGNPVSGAEVSFEVEGGPVLSVIKGTSDADGKAVAELTSTVAGSFKVTATVNGNTVSKNTTFVADATTAAIELTRTNVQETYVAGTRIGYTAVAKDANGNTITDAEFEVKAEGGTAASASITATNNGVAVLSLYDTRAGETKLTATLANNAEVAADDTVTYVPDESSAQISNLTVVKDYAFANSSDEDIITFNATDKYQNLLPGVETSAFQVSVTRGASWLLSQLEDGSFEVKIKGASTLTHKVVINYGSWAASTVNIWFKPLVSAEVEVNNAQADGLSENVVRARLYTVGADGSVAGVANSRVGFMADNGATIVATTGRGYSDADGYVTASITNTTQGVTIVKAISNESLYDYTTEEVEVNFEPVIEIKENNLVIDPDNAPADGVSRNVVTATVTNLSGSPVSGAEVSFEVEAGPVISVVNGTTGADGKAVAELTSLQKGVFNVTVKVNDSEVTKPVTFISDAVIKDENMIVDPDGAISNGMERNQVTAIVTDSAGNPLSGETVVFTVEEEPRLYLYPIITTTGDDGKAVAELSSGQFGTFNITATVNGKSTTKPTTFVQWGIGLGMATIVKDGAIADNRDTNEMKVWVTDGNVNPVEGEVVTFEAQSESSHSTSLVTFEEDSVTTDVNGEAIIRFTARAPGKYKIIARNGGVAGGQTFTFVTSGINEGKSSLDVVPSTIVANNSDTATITLTARDMFENAITGLSGLEFLIEKEDGTAIAEGDISLSAISEGDPDYLDKSGRYTATLKGAKPGRYKITPAVKGNRVGLSQVIELT